MKIRGFRVELTEVEAVLARHPAVKDAKVVAREGPGMPRQLVAYVVPASDRLLHVTDLRSRAAERLPAYMVPAHFVVIPTLPVTPNGKLDYAALPPPAEIRIVRALAPRTPLEAQVAALWQELPGVAASDVTAGFFESGGHSLLSAVLLARVRDRFGVALEIAAVLSGPRPLRGWPWPSKRREPHESSPCAPLPDSPAPRIPSTSPPTDGPRGCLSPWPAWCRPLWTERRPHDR